MVLILPLPNTKEPKNKCKSIEPKNKCKSIEPNNKSFLYKLSFQHMISELSTLFVDILNIKKKKVQFIKNYRLIYIGVALILISISIRILFIPITKIIWK
jgi:hypothetical protein